MRDDLDRGIGPWDRGYDESRSATGPHGIGYGRPGVGGGLSEYMGAHTGRGPRGYQRSDDRIMEDVCERLTWDPDVDATDITVEVQNGVVTLRGTVVNRYTKRHAEDVVCSIRGVQDVQNELKFGIGAGAAGLTGTGDGTTATSGGSIAGLSELPSHNNPERR